MFVPPPDPEFAKANGNRAQEVPLTGRNCGASITGTERTPRLFRSLSGLLRGEGVLTDGRSEIGYERSDAPPRLVALLAAGLAATIIAVLVILAFAFPNALAPATRGPVQALPPAPRLQTDPAGDLLRYRRVEQAKLGKYGWTRDGHVRVPIDQAMNAVAAQGWSEAK